MAITILPAVKLMEPTEGGTEATAASVLIAGVGALNDVTATGGVVALSVGFAAEAMTLETPPVLADGAETFAASIGPGSEDDVDEVPPVVRTAPLPTVKLPFTPPVIERFPPWVLISDP
mgnify:CR=1 FL=1